MASKTVRALRGLRSQAGDCNQNRSQSVIAIFNNCLCSGAYVFHFAPVRRCSQLGPRCLNRVAASIPPPLSWKMSTHTFTHSLQMWTGCIWFGPVIIRSTRFYGSVAERATQGCHFPFTSSTLSASRLVTVETVPARNCRNQPLHHLRIVVLSSEYHRLIRSCAPTQRLICTWGFSKARHHQSGSGQACSAKVHSFGSLSSRKPRKTGARNFIPPSALSCVHSVNLISATSSGFTQCTLAASTSP